MATFNKGPGDVAPGLALWQVDYYEATTYTLGARQPGTHQRPKE